MTTYEFGAVLLVEFPQLTSGTSKRRPGLVLLDVGDDDIVVAPITSKERTSAGDYHLHDHPACGLLKPSWVRLAKPATIAKNDVNRTLGSIPDEDRRSMFIAWGELLGFLPEKK